MPTKVPDSILLEAYARLSSVHKVGKEVGLNHSTVHERLVKLGRCNTLNVLSDEEKAAIKELYKVGFERGSGKVEQLAKKLGRSIGTIYTWASDHGICDFHRPITKERLKSLKDGSTKSLREAQKNGTYVNSMAGRQATPERRQNASAGLKKMWSRRSKQQRAEVILKAMKTKRVKYGRVGNLRRPGKSTWKSQWATVGDKRIYARSSWELAYAKYLQWMKEKGRIAGWEHEVETFWFEQILVGVRSFTPDFRVTITDGSVEFHEVKGWMCSRSKLTIKYMEEFFPNVILRVRDSKWFKKHRSLHGISEAIL